MSVSLVLVFGKNLFFPRSSLEGMKNHVLLAKLSRILSYRCLYRCVGVRVCVCECGCMRVCVYVCVCVCVRVFVCLGVRVSAFGEGGFQIGAVYFFIDSKFQKSLELQRSSVLLPCLIDNLQRHLLELLHLHYL